MHAPAPRQRWIVGGLIFAILETAMIWWRIYAAPLVWISAIWITAAALAAFYSPTQRKSMAWLNICACLSAVGFVEGALWLNIPRNPYRIPEGVTLEGTSTLPHNFIEKPFSGLGYRPRPSSSTTAIKKLHGQLVYDVAYTIGSDGLRRAPRASASPRSCVLMFGDSFAWGEGVNDEQTTAFALGSLSGGDVVVRNFAFTGYSAHQMLWLIRSGEVRDKAHCDPSLPVLAIYQMLPNNVGRVAGLRGWDEYGPSFRLGSDGLITYIGSFEEEELILHDSLLVPRWLATQLERSQLYSRILGRDRRTDEFDDARFAAVVAASRNQLSQEFDAFRFLIILWPDLDEAFQLPTSRTQVLLSRLRAAGLDARPVETWLPNYDTAPATYHIPGDGHPTAETHELLARALLASQIPGTVRGDRQARK